MMRHGSNPALTFFEVFTKHLYWFVRLLAPDTICTLFQVNICFTYSFYLSWGWTDMSSLFCINLSTTLLVRAVNFQILAWIHTSGQTVELYVRGIHLVWHKLNHKLFDSLSYFFLFFRLWGSILSNLFWFSSWT
jgi:hypothetical protein